MSLIKHISGILKPVIAEIVILFIFIFIINNYFGNEDVTIKADAVGYYDYLPSLFIHHDLDRKDIPLSKNEGIYNRISTISLYVEQDGFKVNKCHCGTALLQLPFFLGAKMYTDRNGSINDGYGRPFQISVYYAAVFYLFWALFFLKKILQLYNIRRYLIIFLQLLLVLATPVTIYAHFDPGYSHVYSLFAITLFLYLVMRFFRQGRPIDFFLSCIVFAIVLLIRPLNAMILLFMPFLAGSFQNLKETFLKIWRKPAWLVPGIFIVIAVYSVQCCLWYLQTGHFLVYSYKGETFDFLHPQFINILFSYRKGLFIYTPVLFLALSGVVYLALKRRFYLFSAWLVFFLLITWVFSSWWSWTYGASYGLRTYADYYAVFFIPFAILLNALPRVFRIFVMALTFLTIPLNIIQSYQYKKYILQWDAMNRQKYWKVFLKTDPKYEGLIWKKHFTVSGCSIVKEVFAGDITCRKGMFRFFKTVSGKEVPKVEKVGCIQVSLENDFREKQNDARFLVAIYGANGKHNYFWEARYLLHFADRGFGLWQTGTYVYVIPPVADPHDIRFDFGVISGEYEGVMKNVRIKFISQKKKGMP